MDVAFKLRLEQIRLLVEERFEGGTAGRLSV